MKFKIVWIDDSRTWVKSVESEVKDAFEGLEFDPNIEWFQDTNSAKESILGAYADLLLIDCTLPEGVRGDEFIKELRINRCFAHVVFYSQDADNLQAMEEDKHFIHVIHRDDIADTLESVADQAYRKYKHPAFMRGLLLSEFIDLENLMENLISQCFKGESDYFKQTIIHMGGESFSLAAKKKFIVRLIKEAIEKDGSFTEKLKEIDFTSSQFDKHVTNKRNVLAHAYPEYDHDSGKITLVSAIDNVDFNAEWFHETREKIHEHKSKVRSLIDMNLYQVVNP